MVRVDPRLRAQLAVRREEEDDVLRPERPPCDQSVSLHLAHYTPAKRTFEVARQRQRECDPVQVQFVVGRPPRRNQHNRLCRIAPGRPDDPVRVLPLMRDTGGDVFVVLRRDLQPGCPQDRLDFIRYAVPRC